MGRDLTLILIHMSQPENPTEPQVSNPSPLTEAQNKACAVLQSGKTYVQANPVPIFFGALILGAVLGALLAPRPRKPADPIRSVRDWLESSLDEVSHRLPQVKKKACGLREDWVEQVADLRKKFNL